MRLGVCLLLKDLKVYRNSSWGKFRYLGNLSNVLKLFSDQQASELAFVDVDNSLDNKSFRSAFYRCVQQTNYPITVFSSTEVMTHHSEELINGGLERIGVNISASNSSLKTLNQLVNHYGSSTISVLLNIYKSDFDSSTQRTRFSSEINQLIDKLSLVGIREIIYQDTKTIGTLKGPDPFFLEAVLNTNLHNVISGINGGIRSFNDCAFVANLGIDLICAGNYLSSSRNGDSVLPYYPSRKFEAFILEQGNTSNLSSYDESKPNEHYAECKTCLMDSSFSGFRKIGNYCTYCTDFHVKREAIRLSQSIYNLNLLVRRIKTTSFKKRSQFDCVVGISGGVDSCYVLHHVVSQGLNPIAVTMDNGLNDSTANSNIRTICNKLGVPLVSHVIDWEEYSVMLKSMFSADVIDIELLYDNACQAVCYNKALELGCNYILSGSNTFTEGMRPPSEMSWHKNDVKNILSILYSYQKSLGLKKQRPSTYPFLGWAKRSYATLFRKIEWVKYLDLIDYNKNEALSFLIKEYGFVPYGQKHFENIMTRLYQGYILPNKFSCKKERWHLSMEIISGLVTREDAVKALKENDSHDWSTDIGYVCNLLSLSHRDFSHYIERPALSHDHYASDHRLLQKLNYIYNRFFRKFLFR